MAHWENRHGQVWVNVASHHYVIEDFVNLDDHPYLALLPLGRFARAALGGRRAAVFDQFAAAAKRARLVRHDCRRPLPVAAGTVSHLLCSHFLEHVYPDEARIILRDYRRALRPGGTLHVILPNLEPAIDAWRAQRDDAEAADQLIESTLLTRRARPSLRYRALELAGWEGMQHRWMYTAASAAKLVSDAGFVLSTTNDTPSAHVRAADGDASVHIVARNPGPNS